MNPSIPQQENSERPAERDAPRPSLADLQRVVRATDPAALLVRPRILRRVIKEHRRLGGFALKVPHRKSYVIDRQPLLEIVERAELGLEAGDDLPQRVILLAQPDSRRLADMTAADGLLYCWRLLFHARIHFFMEHQIAQGTISAAGLRSRIQEIGPIEFDEIRAVLHQEGLLLPPRDEATVYVEFAAVYLELKYFAWRFLPRHFPALESPAKVDQLLARDLDAEQLFEATRPEGAPLPDDRAPLSDLDKWPVEGEAEGYEPLPPVKRPSEDKYRRLVRRAQRPAALGNVVGSAIWRVRAERWAPRELAARARAAVKTDISHLVDRLQAALDIRQRNTQAWLDALLALVSQAPRGIWTPEARLLYDLQKVCVDPEREIYTVDLVEWALSLGRRPIKRPLPSQRGALMCKHLRSAARRLAAARIPDSQRQQLSALLREATARTEERVRQRFRPLIARALDEVGLIPQNMPERVSRKKLIEELLDQIVERGFANMGDLRDALSRNHLKLPDLSRPADLFRRDQLLRADRRLGVVLEGVYRRGEVYLRWMQRFSSLGFGTRIGRFLTRFLAVPFGGAFLVVAGIYHLTEDVSGVELPIYNSAVIGLVGLFLFGLMHVGWFRRQVWSALKTSLLVVRKAVVDPLVWLTHSLLIRQILQSRWFRLLFRFVLLPAAVTALACWLVSLRATRWHTSAGTAAATFLAMNLLLNSRLGRNLEEMALDWLAQAWRRYGLRLLSGLFFLVIDIFKGLLENIERLLYTVDEWLRFKSGEGRLSLLLKAGLGLIWFGITYLIRFAVNVLIEPQINPIKHFPVVTVSHKLLLALYYPFAHLLAGLLGIRLAQAFPIALTIIWCIPGVFGFLAWELRENWRLYAANRPKRLKRVMIGHHGESMVRLLKPGFYSGTIPKRYAKLRRAERRARVKGKWKATRKHLEALHHVEEKVRHYVERELLALLSESKCWQGAPLTVQEIHLATNRVRIALKRLDVAESNLEITFDMQSGWLLAGVTSLGWAGQLVPQQERVLTAALVGLYKMAAVDLVRQEIAAAFFPPVPSYELNSQGLVVWPNGSSDVRVMYHLRIKGSIAPPSVVGTAHGSFPTLDLTRLVFREVPIPWDRWVAFWQKDQAGRLEGGDSLSPVSVLPSA